MKKRSRSEIDIDGKAYTLRYHPNNVRGGYIDYPISNPPKDPPPAEVFTVLGQDRNVLGVVNQISNHNDGYHVLSVEKFTRRLDLFLQQKDNDIASMISSVYYHYPDGVVRPSEKGRQLVVGLLKGYAKYFEKCTFHGDLTDLSLYYIREEPVVEDELDYGKFVVSLEPPRKNRDLGGCEGDHEKEMNAVLDIIFGKILYDIKWVGSRGQEFEQDMIDLYDRVKQCRTFTQLHTLADHPALWSWVRRKNYVLNFSTYNQLSITPNVDLQGLPNIYNHTNLELALNLHLNPCLGSRVHTTTDWRDIVKHRKACRVLSNVFQNQQKLKGRKPIKGYGV